jgi:hypothetical protein
VEKKNRKNALKTSKLAVDFDTFTHPLAVDHILIFTPIRTAGIFPFLLSD